MPHHVYDRLQADRTYHAVQGRDHDSETRLLVEATAFGPTERDRAPLLREIPEPEYGGFGWGYNGTGTSITAAAILSDALEVDPVRFDPYGMPAEVDRRLREDFCTDVLAVCADEFRLRRGAVLFPVKSACWTAKSLPTH